MSESPHSRKWKTCKNDPARTPVEDLYRGQKIKSGIIFKLIIGIGLLAIICTFAIPNPKDQAEISDKEIKGKIVEWELEVLVVASLPDHFKILTKPTSYYPGTLLTLYPQNNQQMTYIENVKPGTKIKIKGKITGILQGRIKIDPALLI